MADGRPFPRYAPERAVVVRGVVVVWYVVRYLVVVPYKPGRPGNNEPMNVQNVDGKGENPYFPQ